MGEAQQSPEYVDPDGIPYFKDPTGRYALRGVLGGWWTDFVTDDLRSAIGTDPDGQALLASVPGPIWSAGRPGSVDPSVAPPSSTATSPNPAGGGSWWTKGVPWPAAIALAAGAALLAAAIVGLGFRGQGRSSQVDTAQGESSQVDTFLGVYNSRTPNVTLTDEMAEAILKRVCQSGKADLDTADEIAREMNDGEYDSSTGADFYQSARAVCPPE